MTRTHVRITVKLLVACLVLATASSAPAARPHKNARYIGFEGSELVMELTQVTARVRTSRSGRRFRRGSFVRVVCGSSGRRVSLARTRIRRSGRFSKFRRRGRLRYRIRGRFLRRNYAVLRYTLRVRRCRTGPDKVALYERGIPPFRSCRSQRAKTDVRNAGGRAFQQLRLLNDEFYPHSYGCLFSENRRFELGRNWDDESIELPQLTAPYAGYVSLSCSVASCIPFIAVRDLRDGRVLRDVEASTETVPGRPRSVESLALKSNGSVAWIVDRGTFMGSPRSIDVVAVDTTGRRVLDSGLDIDPQSLSLTGSTLTWQKSGVTRSATLH